MLILISDTFDAQLPKMLERHGEVTTDPARAAEAEIVLVRSRTKVTREYIDKAPKLRLVIRGGVGLDNIDRAYAEQRGIAVRNTAEASTTAVAELAFAMMIAMPCRITAGDTAIRAGQWPKGQLERTELSGKTLGILGLGRIGLALAARARGFKMRVVGWHPDQFFTDFAEIVPSLHETVAQSDFLSLHMPLVDETRGMVNAALLEHFRDGAYLVNTARGEIIVEQDVADALRTGKLGGYAADVFCSEPPAAAGPLLSAPNTIFTPHLGASSAENMQRIGIMVERIVRDYAAGP